MRFDRSSVRINVRGVRTGLTVFLLGVLSGNAQAWAQFDGDPFGPFRAAYRSSTLPIYSLAGPPSSPVRIPQPPGLGSVPGFQGYSPINPVYGFSTGLSSPFAGRTGGFLGEVDPSADAYRMYDEHFGRVYQPNMMVDREYREQTQRLDELYYQMLSERDPRRQQELRRQYEMLSRQSQHLLSRRQPRTRRAAPSASATQPTAPGLPEAEGPGIAPSELVTDPFANLPPLPPGPPPPPPGH